MRMTSTAPDDWILHLGGVMAFVAGFASLYVLSATVAFGFDVMQALYVDMAVFGVGVGLLGFVHLRRAVHRWREIAAFRAKAALFAVPHKSVVPCKSVVVVEAAACETNKARSKKARAHRRPSLDDVGGLLPA